MIKLKRKLHDELFSQNENFHNVEHQPPENPFPNYSDMFKEFEISFLSQHKGRARSSHFQRPSQINLDFSQKINNYNNEPIKIKSQFVRNSIIENPGMFFDGIHIEKRGSAMRSISKNEKVTTGKLIQPNLNAYLEFVDRKWKELKNNQWKKQGEEDKKEQITAFLSERKKYKSSLQHNITNKTRVGHDISYLNLNYKQIFQKLIDGRKNEEENRGFTPNFENYHQKKKRRQFSTHRVKPKHMEFSDEVGLKKDEIMENVLFIKKLETRFRSLN